MASINPKSTPAKPNLSRFMLDSGKRAAGGSLSIRFIGRAEVVHVAHMGGKYAGAPLDSVPGFSRSMSVSDAWTLLLSDAPIAVAGGKATVGKGGVNVSWAQNGRNVKDMNPAGPRFGFALADYGVMPDAPFSDLLDAIRAVYDAAYFGI